MSSVESSEPAVLDSVDELIAAAAASLTPTERRVAEVVLTDPTAVAFGTLAEVARQAETSDPSVVRFAAKIGFAGYSDLQRHLRSTLSTRLVRPADRFRSLGNVGSEGYGAEAAMMLVGDEVDLEHIEAVTRPLISARRVAIVCAQTSAAPGHVLATHLGWLRPGVVSVGDLTAASDELIDFGPDDAVLCIDFPRYERFVVTACEELSQRGCQVVALTDGALSPLASHAEAWIGLSTETVGPFDSVLKPVAMAELIIAQAASRLKDKAMARLDRIEALWEKVGTFHDSQPAGETAAKKGTS